MEPIGPLTSFEAPITLCATGVLRAEFRNLWPELNIDK